MKILFIAFIDSVHTARWINQFKNMNWEIHLFPSNNSNDIHKDLEDIHIHLLFYDINLIKNIKINLHGIPLYKKLVKIFYKLLNKVFPSYRKVLLTRLIKKIKPDIIHTLESQHAGYLLGEAKNLFKENPLWIHSLWGNDLFLFGKLYEHKLKIQNMLDSIDVLLCEGNRDKILARNLGFNKKIFINHSVAGGFNCNKYHKLFNPVITSERKIIMLKGYQGITGRALVGLRALEKCSDLLSDYTIQIFSAETSDVKIAAEIMANNFKISVSFIPVDSSNETMLEYFSNARIYIGLSISDGLPLSVFEAMTMGAFPIQSDTSMFCEWIKNGNNGFLVSPNDPEIVEKAIRQALIDNEMVNKASRYNYNLINKKLNYFKIKKFNIKLYQKLRKNLSEYK
ncbi:MAG: glycosyl transferase group 1 [uncultured bacterium]|nr:MAG: glycosyl transferase group 1 [uncultured bacterium]